MTIAFLMSVAISIIAAFNVRPATLMFDENYYYPVAEKITQGNFEDGYVVRPPLYPLLLAGILSIFGKGFASLLVIQSILRGLVVVIVGWLAKRYFDSRTAVVSGVILAIYPLFIWTYTRFVSEIIYIPLFLLSFLLLDKALNSRRSSDTWVAGLTSGLAALARSTSFFFTIVVAVWLVLRKADGRRFSPSSLCNAMLLVAGMLVIISPWTVRNIIVHRSLILIDNTTPFNLWLITSGETIKQVEKEWLKIPSQGERQKEGYRRWLSHLKSDPLFHIRRLPRVLAKLLSPARDPSLNSLAVIIHGTHVHTNRQLRSLLGIIVPVWTVLLIAGGIVGIIFLEKNSVRRDLVILTLCFFVLLHGMTLGRPRFLLPMSMLLAIYAGATCSRVLPRLGSTRQSRPSQS